MKYFIENDTDTFTLNKVGTEQILNNCNISFNVKFAGADRRIKTVDRYAKPGSRTTGDKQIGARDITIEAMITRTLDVNENDFINAVNNIIGLFDDSRGVKYLIQQSDDNTRKRRAEIEMKNFDESSIADGNDLTAVVLTIDCIWVTGVFEDYTPTVVTSPSDLSNNQTMSVTVDSNEIAFPVVQVTLTGDSSEITVKNITTGVFTSIGDNSLIAGAVVTIDSVNGNIYINDVESSGSLITGSGFMQLSPGLNTIQFQTFATASASIVITYRNRYLK